MKGKSLFILLGAAVMASCSGNKGTQTTDSANSEEIQKNTVDLRGQWCLENIVFDDTTYVRPAEQTPDVRQYITFQDSTFSIQTNCNTIQGRIPYFRRLDLVPYVADDRNGLREHGGGGCSPQRFCPASQPSTYRMTRWPVYAAARRRNT